MAASNAAHFRSSAEMSSRGTTATPPRTPVPMTRTARTTACARGRRRTTRGRVRSPCSLVPERLHPVAEAPHRPQTPLLPAMPAERKESMPKRQRPRVVPQRAKERNLIDDERGGTWSKSPRRRAERRGHPELTRPPKTTSRITHARRRSRMTPLVEVRATKPTRLALHLGHRCA